MDPESPKCRAGCTYCQFTLNEIAQFDANRLQREADAQRAAESRKRKGKHDIKAAAAAADCISEPLKKLRPLKLISLLANEPLNRLNEIFLSQHPAARDDPCGSSGVTKEEFREIFEKFLPVAIVEEYKGQLEPIFDAFDEKRTGQVGYRQWISSVGQLVLPGTFTANILSLYKVIDKQMDMGGHIPLNVITSSKALAAALGDHMSSFNSIEIMLPTAATNFFAQFVGSRITLMDLMALVFSNPTLLYSFESLKGADSPKRSLKGVSRLVLMRSVSPRE
jgi:Ca2+-binding EF-hand superfamily protein